MVSAPVALELPAETGRGPWDSGATRFFLLSADSARVSNRRPDSSLRATRGSSSSTGWQPELQRMDCRRRYRALGTARLDAHLPQKQLAEVEDKTPRLLACAA